MPGDSARHLSVQLRDKLHAESHGALLVLVPRKVRAIERREVTQTVGRRLKMFSCTNRPIIRVSVSQSYSIFTVVLFSRDNSKAAPPVTSLNRVRLHKQLFLVKKTLQPPLPVIMCWDPRGWCPMVTNHLVSEFKKRRRYLCACCVCIYLSTVHA